MNWRTNIGIMTSLFSFHKRSAINLWKISTMMNKKFQLDNLFINIMISLTFTLHRGMAFRASFGGMWCCVTYLNVGLTYLNVGVTYLNVGVTYLNVGVTYLNELDNVG